MLKKILWPLIPFIFLLGSFAHADLFTMGVPTNLTMTTTAVSATVWTLLLDSDLSSPKPAKLWAINEKSGDYDFYYSYNSVTYTIVDDYRTVYAGTGKSFYLAIPDGVYCKTTWAAGGTINVQFESAK
jgi:hypothetical protein